MRWELHVGIALHPRDLALKLIARHITHRCSSGCRDPHMDGIMSSTLAQRDPPMRLSPSAIPLAVTTTPKSTAAGTEGSMAYHPTAQGVPHTCKPPPLQGVPPVNRRH